MPGHWTSCSRLCSPFTKGYRFLDLVAVTSWKTIRVIVTVASEPGILAGRSHIFLAVAEASRTSIMFSSRSFVLFVSFVTTTFSVPATYDQRQTGDLNVDVYLKNVQILALVDSELLDDYTDYDYFYDYADFTVKPSTAKPTTESTPMNISDALSENSTFSETTEKNTIMEVSESSSENSTVNIESTSESAKKEANVSLAAEEEKEDSTNSTKDAEEFVNTKTKSNIVVKDVLNMKDDSSFSSNINVEKSSEKPAQQLSRKRCRSGYSPSGKGRCRRVSRRRLSLLPLAMQFAEDTQRIENKSR